MGWIYILPWLTDIVTIYLDHRRKIGKKEARGGVNKTLEREWIEGTHRAGLVKLPLFDYAYKWMILFELTFLEKST